jgi:hypothetical protein
VGAVGRACKLAFSYGLESDPEVASTFLSKLTLKARHAYITAHMPRIKPLPNRIPLKVVTNVFLGMPKKSVVHKDGWTWELMRDTAQTPSIAALLRKLAELFSNGALPPDLWAYLASTLLYPFHKKLQEDKNPVGDPAIRAVTIGSGLTRFGCIVMVRVNRLAVAEVLLLSHQFFFEINGGVQQVLLACNIALEINFSVVADDGHELEERAYLLK